MRSRYHINLAAVLAGAAVLFVLCLQADPAMAQRPVLEGAASAGTGLSFGPGDGETVVMMTPTYLNLDIIYFNDESPKLEYVIGFQAELQGRVSVGIVPQFRFNTGPEKFMMYGIIGVPLVFAPFVLFGVEAGAGALFWVNETVGLFGQLVVDLYFLGNDLQDDGMLAQLNLDLGVRISF